MRHLQPSPGHPVLAVRPDPGTVSAAPYPQPPSYTGREGRLGIAVGHRLLERALTHRSYAYENGGLPTNERLEFLGDSVLGVVITTALFHNHPDLPEGQL